MKISELAEFLSSKSEELDEDAEILVEQDGYLYEFEIKATEAMFDGFDSYFPEGLKIVVLNGIKEDL